MNKQILLQSIKSVSGYLALLAIGILLLVFVLSNVNPIIGTSLLIIGVFIGMVWFDYITRLDRSTLVTKTKIKG
jgi:hypothetical protein